MCVCIFICMGIFILIGCWFTSFLVLVYFLSFLLLVFLLLWTFTWCYTVRGFSFLLFFFSSFLLLIYHQMMMWQYLFMYLYLRQICVWVSSFYRMPVCVWVCMCVCVWVCVCISYGPGFSFLLFFCSSFLRLICHQMMMWQYLFMYLFHGLCLMLVWVSSFCILFHGLCRSSLSFSLDLCRMFICACVCVKVWVWMCVWICICMVIFFFFILIGWWLTSSLVLVYFPSFLLLVSRLLWTFSLSV